MKKYRVFFYNLKQEEEWINAIQKGGYRLTAVNPLLFRYTFEKLHEEDFVKPVRLDFRSKMTSEDFQEYLTLFNDSGWKFIYGDKWAGKNIF
ncbi:DUF2812 domain-containing protein [Streptococcus dentasini]